MQNPAVAARMLHKGSDREGKQEEEMNKWSIELLVAIAVNIAIGLSPALAQEPAQDNPAPSVQEQPAQKADGRRGDLPLEAYAVAPGTKFLVRLEDELDTKETRENHKFKVR